MQEEIKKYFIVHKARILLIILIGIGFSYSNIIPYINLFLPNIFYISTLFILASILLKISPNVHIIIAILLLFLTFPWLIVGNRTSIENIGILIFFSILIAVIKKE